MNRTMRRPVRALIALSVLTMAAASAATALGMDVTGRIEAPAGYGAPAVTPRDPQSREYYWYQRIYFLDPRPFRYQPARELAVILTGTGQATGDQPGFRFRNGGLYPRTIVARVGEALQIANDDPVTYELMADNLGTFGAVPTPPGRTRTLEAFAAAGHWALHDRVQAHVTGHLHVIPDLVARGEIRADGSYVFHGVPAGTYALKVLEGEREIATRPVTVIEGHELAVDPIHLGAAPPAAPPAPPQ
jgi:hypothetical protein